MNKKQKKQRAALAVTLTVVLGIVLLFTVIMSCAGKDVRQAAATTPQRRSTVVISEILASNRQAVRDPMGTYSDYVELHNTGSEPVNLSGYGLSDSETKVWVLAEGTILRLSLIHI